jgi:hypothetical protein
LAASSTTYNTWFFPEGQVVLDEIKKCDLVLLELARERKFDTIQPNIPIQCMHDGLHPSTHGVEKMKITIRNYLKNNKMIDPSSSLQIPSLLQIVTPIPSLMSINLLNIQRTNLFK